MPSLILLFILPALTFFALLLSGFLLRKEWLPLRAAVAGLLVLAGGVFLQARHDYGWATGILDELPADAMIVHEARSSLSQRPWTLWHQPVTRLAAIQNVREVLELNGGFWLELELLRFELARDKQALSQTVMLNCTTLDRVTRQSDGVLIESLPESDPMLQLLCPKDQLSN